MVQEIIYSQQSPKQVMIVFANEGAIKDDLTSHPQQVEEGYCEQEQLNLIDSDSPPHSPQQLASTKQKRKYRIKSPSACRRCQQEIKGQCPTCQLKELKGLLREKDKQLRSAMRIQAEATRYSDRLKSKLKVKSKLKTSKQQLKRMKRYAQEVAVTLANLKEY